MQGNKYEFQSLISKAIEEYESDTFSAEDARVTKKEAHVLAKFFIRRLLGGGNVNAPASGHNALEAMNVDGLQLSEVLEWLRNGEIKIGNYK